MTCFVNAMGRHNDPVTACGKMESPKDGITLHQSDVTCLDCLKVIGDEPAFSFYPDSKSGKFGKPVESLVPPLSRKTREKRT